jgi:hypothetical protein
MCKTTESLIIRKKFSDFLEMTKRIANHTVPKGFVRATKSCIFLELELISGEMNQWSNKPTHCMIDSPKLVFLFNDFK